VDAFRTSAHSGRCHKYVRAKGFTKLQAYTDELAQCLKADALRPKKDRRTARALFAQIKVSGNTGGYTRVTDFIRAWRDDEGSLCCLLNQTAYAGAYSTTK